MYNVEHPLYKDIHERLKSEHYTLRRELYKTTHERRTPHSSAVSRVHHIITPPPGKDRKLDSVNE